MTILELLDTPGIRSTRQIADALGTSVEMAEARLEHYARLGYLKKTVFSPDCGGVCQNCRRCGGRGEGHSAPIVCWEK